MESYPQHQLQDIDPQDGSLENTTKVNLQHPTRSLVSGRTFSQGIYGLAFALLANALWFAYLTLPSQITPTIPRLSTASHETWFPHRTYPQDENFLLIDYSPWLGLNNMRYMLERGLYIANLLNRTLVVPNQLRIRSCSDPDICADTAIQLNLDTIGYNPQNSTMALDLAYFFDLKTLFDKSHGRIVDFRRFMKEVVGVPVDSALVDSEFGAQIAYWSERISQQDSPTPGSIQDFRATAFTDNESDEYLDENEVNGGSDQHPIQLTRIHRDTWNADFSEELSTVDNAIRNGLIDDFATHPPIDAHIQQLVRKTFYAFSDVRGGGMDRIVEWSLNFSYTPNIGDQGQPSYVLTPLLDQDSCQPPADDPSVEFIPWEARFPSFATCRIDHYVGIKQQLEPIQSRILSIDGQFHTTGWIPIAYSSLENAQRYRDIASSYLQSAPVVDRAIDHLFRNLHNMIVGVNDNDIKINGDPAPWLKLSMHVRRGDFLTSGMGWQDFHDSWMEALVKDAVENVFGKDADGVELAKGRFYLATDEISAHTMNYFRSLGAIMFQDLVDDTFKDLFGHLSVFDDWIGVVEQHICARATRFIGTMSSSFTSGIVNIRMKTGSSLERDLNYGYLLKSGGPVLTKEQEKQ